MNTNEVGPSASRSVDAAYRRLAIDILALDIATLARELCQPVRAQELTLIKLAA